MLATVLYDFASTKIRHNRQIVVVKMLTEEASKSNDILYDKLRISTKDVLVPGDTYRLTIDFQIVDKYGKRMMTSSAKQTDNQANLGCTRLEYSEKFVALKEHMQVYLQMAVTDAEIMDSDGNVVDFKKQKLAPIITVEKEIEN